MYNAHRGIPPAPSSRLTELLDQVRQEFDNQQSRAGEYEQNMAQQVQEMELVRQKVYNLEQNQNAIKQRSKTGPQRYEEDIARLRHELEARGGPPSHVSINGLPPHAGVPQPQPPVIGHGPSNLFGGIMANPPGQGAPGLVPPTQEQQQQQQQQQVPPAHQMGGSQGLQQGSFGGYPQPHGVNGGKSLSGQEHNVKTHSKGGLENLICIEGYNPQPPQTTASPGPGKGRVTRGPPGPTTPHQAPSTSYPDPRPSPQLGRPPSPPQHQGHQIINNLADLELESLRPEQKREGNDWFAIFNPRIPRVLDVDLVHTLSHDSVVCCVRFSYDGRYVATGCNRSAQIFDVGTGAQVTKLQDESVDKEGDLYIRSVCFSPDGKYLATGAEDKQIRVWDIASQAIRNTFVGHEQDIYSLDFARDGKHIASGSGDRTVRVWDIDSGREVLSLNIDDGVTTVAISPGGEFVSAGSLDKSVRVWDVRSGHLIDRLDGNDGHKDSVYSVAFAPNGRSLVSGSLDKTIKMWELADARAMMGPGMGSRERTGKCVKTFEGHKDFVLSVALTPDGRWVLSGSKDRGVQFWDPRTGDAQLMLQGHKNS
ncbi:MAG: hypothetical protein Q9196_004725, partial [Gyalolechia fulgens]